MTRTTALFAVALGLTGCTDVSLYSAETLPNIPNKIALTGDVCTEIPTSLDFPIKVLVVMDGSHPFVDADTTGARTNAVKLLIDRFRLRSSYRFGIIQYGATATSATSGFPRDISTVDTAVGFISGGTGEYDRSYINALRSAVAAVQDDLLSSPPGIRSRTRYEILWVSGGQPVRDLKTSFCSTTNLDPMSAACSTNFLHTFCPMDNPAPADCEALLYQRTVSGLRDFVLQHGGQELQFHAIAAGDDARMESLLASMAASGRGSYFHQDVAKLDLLAVDLTVATSALRERELVVYNPNTLVTGGRLTVDSDGDGLSDELEAQIGTDPTLADTDGDFVGDGIELRLQAPSLRFDPLRHDVFDECSLLMYPDVDTDEDGLSDCEEAVLRTDPSLVDSDKDGIPDLVEVRRGGNPLVDDSLVSTAKDGIVDTTKMKEGLQVTEDAAPYELDLGYHYQVVDEGTKTVSGFDPPEPIPGVRILKVGTTENLISTVRYDPGPPATVSFLDRLGGLYGPAVDVSAGGMFDIVAGTANGDPGTKLTVIVDPTILPLPVLGPKQVSVVIGPVDRNCFRFDVRNVSLVQTLEVPGGRPGPGWQILRVYMAQLPTEGAAATTSYPVFDQALVPIRFIAPDQKLPNVPVIPLEQDSFSLVAGSL